MPDNVLDNSTTKAALRQIGTRLKEKVEAQPGAGKVWNRIRYAVDLPTWKKIATVKKVNKVTVIRCAFIYFTGWTTSPAECRTTLLQPNFAIEIIQGYEDGTDADNSTLVYQDFLADLIDSFNRDKELGFTGEGAAGVLHTGLQGSGGDGRPEWVDGILAHRKVCNIQVNFHIKSN